VTETGTSAPRALVTGAGGFIGRHCLPDLVQRGFEVHAVSSGRREPAGDGVRWHRADLLDAEDVRALVAAVRPSHLLHLAWETGHGRFWSSADNLRWLAGGAELMRAFAEAGGARAVVAGTCAEYRWDDRVCAEATTPLEPRTLYGACKHALHVAAAAHAAQAGVSLAWGRVFFLYGPGEQPGRLVPSVVRPLLRGEPAECSHGRQVRDFLDVEDAAGAFVALLAGGVEGAVNIASGRPTTVAEVAEAIGDLTGRPELVRLGARPSPPGEPAVLVADATRLTREVGWRPRYDLHEGLRRAVEWWREPVRA
jgi:nucleoside-diphosphate-sugar epimerase